MNQIIHFLSFKVLERNYDLVKPLYVFSLLLILLVPAIGFGQTSGRQDSVLGDPLRPRRDTYLIEPFPSPALRGQVVQIQYYNHNEEETSLYIVDINDRVVSELQPRKIVPNGIHSFPFQTNLVSTGAYHIRLKRYTSSGSELETQDLRFIVVH